LANRNAPAQTRLYRDQFGLNLGQIQRIAHAEPKRQFLVVQASSSRFIDLQMTPEMIAVLRSDQKAQAVFDACYQESGEDWRDRYLTQIQDVVMVTEERAA